MADLTYVKGLDQLQKLLDTLPAKVEANIMRGALRAGGVVMRKEAQVQLQSNGSVKTGLLSKGIKVGSKLRKGVVTAVVKTTGKHGYLGPWLEYGTAAHRIVPKRAKVLFLGGLFAAAVEHPGSKPKPFMRPAMESQTAQTLLAVGEYVKKRLTKAGIEQASEVQLEVDE